MPGWRELSLPVKDLDLPALLGFWRWLLFDVPYDPVALTSFGDWFLKAPDGSVHFLDLLEGALSPVATDGADFERQAATEERQNSWFMSEMLDLLKEKGVRLKPGECYGYKVPPIVGGPVESDNIQAFDLRMYQSLQGQLHEQIKYRGPGAPIRGFRLQE